MIDLSVSKILSSTIFSAGEYTCTAENVIAKDSITHKLEILGKISLQTPKEQLNMNEILSAPPQAPQVIVGATTTDSITVKLKKHETDSAPLHGYTLHYKPEFGEWETADVSTEAQKHTIENLVSRFLHKWKT